MSIQVRYNKDGTIKDYRVFVDHGKTIDGKRDRPSRVCKTMKEAKKAEIALEVEKSGLHGRSNRITFSDFVDSHWLPEKEKTLRKTTIMNYKRDIKLRLRPAFGNLYLSDITKLRIQSMISRCPTYKTGKNARDTLSAILGYAVDMELLPRNAARSCYQYKPKELSDGMKLGEVIGSFSEHMRIINLASDYDTKAILVLGFCFGLRKGEILGLDWSHIDLVNKKLHVRKTFTKGEGAPVLTPPKTKKSERDLPIGKHAEKLLKELRDWGGITRIKGPMLTCAGHRMYPRTAWKRVNSLREAYTELPRITPSSLRHSFATAWVLSGGNVASLSRWLGHTNVSTTLNRYVIPLMNDLADDACRIDSFYEIKEIAV